jgi:CubicO group peptidase (beta-lactamase class C family)
VPGVQYAVFGAHRILFEYVGGLADVGRETPMAPGTTLMAFSMTKTFTAAAILQLVERRQLGLDERLRTYLPEIPYDDAITIRQLLIHTSGIPNPIPLRWVHSADQHDSFDESAALARVLHDHPRLSSRPGQKYNYSNIGYWLLAKVVEQVSGARYSSFVQDNLLRPLGLGPDDMDFVVIDWANHATGYLAKYSMMNLLKGLLTDRWVWGEYEGKWLSLRSSYVNGAGFGGLVGSGRAFGRFLQDQLRDESALFGPATKNLFYTRQKTDRGEPTPMSLGWHLGTLKGDTYYFKEGGGRGVPRRDADLSLEKGRVGDPGQCHRLSVQHDSERARPAIC